MCDWTLSDARHGVRRLIKARVRELLGFPRLQTILRSAPEAQVAPVASHAWIREYREQAKHEKGSGAPTSESAGGATGAAGAEAAHPAPPAARRGGKEGLGWKLRTGSKPNTAFPIPICSS